MNNIFRRLPLPAKLLLIGVIPLALLIYTSLQIYSDKKEKVDLLSSYIERIRQSVNINILIDDLGRERKISFDYHSKKAKQKDLLIQRRRTDSAMQQLEKGSLSGFTDYTFLKDLQKIRNLIDSGYLPPDQVMHFYTTATFRINTLNTVSHGSEIYLKSVHKDLWGQKLLSEMITSLGIMRSNIYNILSTKKYMMETLAGMIGLHDVYRTYETEFLLKASPKAIGSYKDILRNTSLKPTVEYIDTLFKQFKPDSSYQADEWWNLSSDGLGQLVNLRQSLWTNIIDGTNIILKREKTAMNRTFILLALGLLLVIGIVVYTVISISRSLTEMKIAAQRISEGASDLQLHVDSKDVIGNLAQSILKIDATNKLLANAADAIGKGNFDVKVEPRGKEDILGNAVVRMKENLLQNMQVITENNELLRELTFHLQNIREEERASMAREVHDELGQQITCIKMDVSWLLKRIKTDDPQEQEKMKAIPELLDHTSTTVRKIATELRPSILDDFGLIDALEWQGREFEKRSGISVQFSSAVSETTTLGQSINTAIFRIYQESLTNVARHAAATSVAVNISLQDGDKLLLTITDNGKGFDVTGIGHKKTLGLLGMKERTTMIGGKYEITSNPGTGTTITVTAPIKIKPESN